MRLMTGSTSSAGVKLGKQQPELVATEARNGVRRADRVAHAPAHLDQQLVAGRGAPASR